MDSRALRWSGMAGHFDIVKFLHLYLCPIDRDVIAMTAAGGHFPIVKWMHLHHFAEDHRALNFACEGQNYDIVQYFIQHPHTCPLERCQRRWQQPHLMASFQPVSAPPLPGRSIFIIGAQAIAFVAQNGEWPMVDRLRKCGGLWDHQAIINTIDQLPPLPTRPCHDEFCGYEDAKCSHDISLMNRWVDDKENHYAYLNTLRFLWDNGCPLPVGGVGTSCCPVLFDGCVGMNCWDCRQIERQGCQPIIRPLLAPYVPQSLVSYGREWVNGVTGVGR